jgi:hypothetical protein
MIAWIIRLLITLTLIATNLLTLTNAAFNAAVSSLMGTMHSVCIQRFRNRGRCGRELSSRRTAGGTNL